MTVLHAYDQTDLESFNLNYWYANQTQTVFNDDAYELGWDDNYHIFAGSDALSLYGYDFAYDPEELPGSFDMNVGFIQALSQWGWVVDPEDLVNGGYWEERWHWSGWDDFSMLSFWNAGQTTDLGDDFDVITAVLSEDDTFYMSDYDDSFLGFKGNDTFYGRKGADVLDGLDGDDTLFGDRGADELTGGRGDDLLSGGKGDDMLDGGNNNDIVKGGYGNDVLFGGAGKGNDYLAGGRHADYLDGGAGNDTLLGGGGEDTLLGGEGDDVLDGGGRMDVFVFATGDGNDIITDFDAIGEFHDTIDLAAVTSITDWNDLAQNHLSQNGADAVIDAGNGDKITLVNVELAQLDQGDFIFTV